MWYSRVVADLGAIPDFIAHYENELEDAKRDVRVGGLIEKNIKELPGITEHRFNQLQEIEAILEQLNIEVRKLRSAKFRQFTEHYNRALTSRDAEKYVDGEPDVVNMDSIVNEFALVRNKFIGITKALDSKQFQVSNVTRLRVAGMEDAELR